MIQDKKIVQKIKSFVTIELSVSLLRLYEDTHYQQPLSKSFSFNHAISTSILHCSVHYIICGIALKFSVIVYYE